MRKIVHEKLLPEVRVARVQLQGGAVALEICKGLLQSLIGNVFHVVVVDRFALELFSYYNVAIRIS